MSNNSPYSPIFEGEFPTSVSSRWDAVCNFVSAWCVPEGIAFPELDNYESRLIWAAMDIYHKDRSSPEEKTGSLRDLTSLSKSTQRWFALGEQAVLTPSLKILIRERVDIFPLEDVLPTLPIPRSAVILCSQEGDIVWAIQEARWADDDPPVDIYCTLEELGLGHCGTISSVSEFVLRQVLTENTSSAKCAETFGIRYAESDLEVLRAWFDYSLKFDSGGELSGPSEIMESENVVAIINSKRHLQVSIFCQPDTLALPPILLSGLAKEREWIRKRQDK